MKPQAPRTAREWFSKTDARLSILERHRHPGSSGAGLPGPPGPPGSAMLGIRTIRGINNTQFDITTGNGSGNPYTRMVFRNYTFGDIDGGTFGLVPPLTLHTETDAFAFDVTETGFYQCYIEVGFSFEVTAGPPEVTHWRFDTYNDYFEFVTEPHPGWGVAFGSGGSAQTWVTPPFYEPAWTDLDGTNYLSLASQWRTLGKTMLSQFGNTTPSVTMTLVRLA